jgi:hypothetical protein
MQKTLCLVGGMLIAYGRGLRHEVSHMVSLPEVQTPITSLKRIMCDIQLL